VRRRIGPCAGRNRTDKMRALYRKSQQPVEPASPAPQAQEALFHIAETRENRLRRTRDQDGPAVAAAPETFPDTTRSSDRAATPGIPRTVSDRRRRTAIVRKRHPWRPAMHLQRCSVSLEIQATGKLTRPFDRLERSQLQCGLFRMKK
jgi:hypothetical protein